jgi:hypothetical protein
MHASTHARTRAQTDPRLALPQGVVRLLGNASFSVVSNQDYDGSLVQNTIACRCEYSADWAGYKHVRWKGPKLGRPLLVQNTSAPKCRNGASWVGYKWMQRPPRPAHRHMQVRKVPGTGSKKEVRQLGGYE